MAERLKWLDINEKLIDGVKKVNSLSDSDFMSILNHIKESKNPLREIGSLQQSLNISSGDLNTILQCITLIYKESHRVILKPTDLYNQLTSDLKLDDKKAEELVKIWSEGVRNRFGNFENNLKLSNFSWELNLETASTYSSNTANPTAKIQFEITDSNKDELKDIVTLENLDKEALNYLYNTFEVIQKKLDAFNT